MIGVLVVLTIAGIIGLIAFAYDESNGFTTMSSLVSSASSTAIEGMEGIRKLSEQFNEAGDSVSFFAPKSVSQETNDSNGGIFDLFSSNNNNQIIKFFNTETGEEIHPDMDTGYTLDDASGKLYFDNGTKVPEISYINTTVTDTSYSREFQLQEKQQIGSNGQMMVQISNIAIIQGQIKILDPKTGEIVEPRIYKYWLTIECSDLIVFCNLNSITMRSITNTDGTFLEKWATSLRDMPGLYNVNIMAESETTNELGKKYIVEGSLQIELFT